MFGSAKSQQDEKLPIIKGMRGIPTEPEIQTDKIKPGMEKFIKGQFSTIPEEQRAVKTENDLTTQEEQIKKANEALKKQQIISEIEKSVDRAIEDRKNA